MADTLAQRYERIREYYIGMNEQIKQRIMAQQEGNESMAEDKNSLWQMAGLLPAQQADETIYPDLQTYVDAVNYQSGSEDTPQRTPAEQRTHRTSRLASQVKRLQAQAKRIKKLERDRVNAMRQLARCTARYERAVSYYNSIVENARNCTETLWNDL